MSSPYRHSIVRYTFQCSILLSLYTLNGSRERRFSSLYSGNSPQLESYIPDYFGLFNKKASSVVFFILLILKSVDLSICFDLYIHRHNLTALYPYTCLSFPFLDVYFIYTTGFHFFERVSQYLKFVIIV